jgi:hypothetical protein
MAQDSLSSRGQLQEAPSGRQKKPRKRLADRRWSRRRKEERARRNWATLYGKFGAMRGDVY